MKAKLVVVGGDTSTTEVNLRLPSIIGRGRSAQVTIPHSLVSRRHCEISEADGHLVVRDLDSLNGTYVGNERITEARLDPGALLTVGTVTFRAVYEVAEHQPQSKSGTDTCRPDTSLDETADVQAGVETQLADDETVPVEASTFREALLPPRVTDPLEVLSDEAPAKEVPDRSG